MLVLGWGIKCDTESLVKINLDCYFSSFNKTKKTVATNVTTVFSLLIKLYNAHPLTLSQRFHVSSELR